MAVCAGQLEDLRKGHGLLKWHVEIQTRFTFLEKAVA
jgi:hypothetical protein